MNRRSLLKSLLALPFIGAAVKASAEPTYVDPFWDNPYNFERAMRMMDHRRLLEHLHRRYSEVVSSVIFEPNDQETRKKIAAEMSATLDHYLSARTIVDYAVICDEGNNTPHDIANDTINIDIAYKMYNGTEFNHVPFTAKINSAKFSEIS